MYEDIALLQVFDPGLIYKPAVTELAKFTLSCFKSGFIISQQAQATAEQQKNSWSENHYQRVRWYSIHLTRRQKPT
ncbi:MAG TPA: hypothetical protein VE223_04425 [Nitrososphaeraceae archaeon]|nr:hypothetical protein [Nitrososphaeraceae archaeon]